MRSRLAKLKIHLAICLLTPLLAHASPWEESFLGLSRSANLDTLGDGDGRDPFAIAGNPAWHAGEDGFGILVGSQSSWLGHRVTEDPRLGFLALALQQHFSFLKFGLLSVIPLGESLALDTGTIDGRASPWNVRARQFHLQPSVALHWPQSPWSIGIAAPVALNTTAQADLDFDSTHSNSRFKAGLEPKLTYLLGLAYAVSDTWKISLAYREKQSPTASVTTVTQVPLPGNLDVTIVGEGQASYFFEPRRVTAQSSWALGSRWHAGVWARFSDWSQMPPPYLVLSFTTPKIQPPPAPAFRTRDTVEAAAGVAYDLTATHQLTAAYRYQPTPFLQAPHYYDSNQHQLGLGHRWSTADGHYALHSTLRVQLLEKGGLYTYLGLGLSSGL